MRGLLHCSATVDPSTVVDLQRHDWHPDDPAEGGEVRYHCIDSLLPPTSGETCLDRALRLRIPLTAAEVLIILKMQMHSHGDVVSFGLPARPRALLRQTGVFIEHPKLRRQSNADRWKQHSRSAYSSEYGEAYGLVTAQAGFECRYYEHCFPAAALGGLDGLKHPGCCTP